MRAGSQDGPPQGGTGPPPGFQPAGNLGGFPQVVPAVGEESEPKIATTDTRRRVSFLLLMYPT